MPKNRLLIWSMHFLIGPSSSKTVRFSFYFVSLLKTLFSAVWIVSNEQLLDWVRHPVPVSQLDQIASLKCLTPQVDQSTKICNGIPRNEAGLTVRCPFNDSPFNTCVCAMSCCVRIPMTTGFLITLSFF